MKIRRLNPLSWETGLGKLEPAYLKYYLKADASQFRFTSFLSIVLSLYFIRTDYLFFGFSRSFYALLLLRCLYFLMGTLILLRLSKPLVPGQLRSLMIIQLWAAVFFMSAINSTRPRDYMDYSTVNMIFLFGAYLFNSLPVNLRFIGSFVFTLIEFFNLSTKAITSESWLALISSYALVNILGFIIAIWFVNNRRQQFMLLAMERKHRLKVEKLSNLDVLTGAKNRRFFLRRGSSEVERAIRYQRPLSLAIIDLDGLKKLNDAHGHPLGDKAICALADVFKLNIRKQDIFARLGGDEFGLLMPETKFAEACQLVDRIKLDLYGAPLHVNGCAIRMTFSAGLAESRDTCSLTDLVQIADENLYQAKNNGRNRVMG